MIRRRSCGRFGALKRAWDLLVLLAAAALVLVSLNLPWEQASCSSGASDVGCFDHRTDGWSSVGQVAALSALLLLVLAAAALVRPRLRVRLPLGQCALAAAYFTLGVFVEARVDARQEHETAGGHFQLAYGTYVGVAAGLLALLGAAALRRDEVLFRPPGRAWLPLSAAAALLVALLLPWSESLLLLFSSVQSTPTTVHVGHLSALGLADAGGVICAAVALRFIVVRWRDGTEAWLGLCTLALAAVLFAGAAFTVNFPVTRVYGAWVGLAAAMAMLLLAVTDRPRAKLVWSRRQGTGTGIAFLVFATSLFLPWQRACYPQGREFASVGVSGRCISTNGWTLETSAAALAAAGLVAVAFAPSLRRFARGELAAGVALLVATSGFLLQTGVSGGIRLSLGYGSIVGFVAAGLLVGLALERPHVSVGDRSRAAPALLAIAFGAAYVTAVVLPWWDVLPTGVWSVFALGLTRLSWLTIAALAVGLRLIRLWWSRLRDRSASADELVLLPLALVALAVLDAVRAGGHLTWNSALLGGLALALTGLGLVERSGGLGAIEIPAILRVDRIQ